MQTANLLRVLAKPSTSRQGHIVIAKFSSTGTDHQLSKEKVQFKPAAQSDNTESSKVTALEFLKKFKKENTVDKFIAQKRQSTATAIETENLPSPLVFRKSQEEIDQERFAEKLFGNDVPNPNKVPKVYQLPDYNNLTKPDMWNILRKTIIFENSFVFAINKPSGVPMHSPSVDCRHFMIEFLDKFAQLTRCEIVYPLHRLDKETTGVLLFAKEERTAKYIKEKFALRQVNKKYLAIVKGNPHISEGTVKIPIGYGRISDTGKYRSVLKPDLREYDIKTRQNLCREAITHFKVIRSVQEASFLDISTETGLKHQVRLHMGLGLGCPIIGDHKYSHRDRLAPQRLHPRLLHKMKVKQSKLREVPLHLHCNAVSFTLPEEVVPNSEPLFIHCHIPLFFRNTLNAFGLR